MFIFSAKNLTQMYRRLSFIRQYSSYQKVQGEAVKAKQKQVNEKHQQLQHVKGHKNTLLYKGKQEKTALEGKADPAAGNGAGTAETAEDHSGCDCRPASERCGNQRTD